MNYIKFELMSSKQPRNTLIEEALAKIGKFDNKNDDRRDRVIDNRDMRDQVNFYSRKN